MQLINFAHLLNALFALILPTAVLAWPRRALSAGLLVRSSRWRLRCRPCSTAQAPAAGLAGVALRPAALMLAFYLGTGGAGRGEPAPAGGACVALGFAGFSRHLPPDRHRHAGGGRRQARSRALGLNGVFGNLGVASAPLVTAFPRRRPAGAVGFAVPGVVCIALGLWWVEREIHPKSRATCGQALPRHSEGRSSAAHDRHAVDLGSLRPRLQRLYDPAAETDGRSGWRATFRCLIIGALAFAALAARSRNSVGRLIDHHAGSASSCRWRSCSRRRWRLSLSRAGLARLPLAGLVWWRRHLRRVTINGR